MGIYIPDMEMPEISENNGISCCLYKTLAGALRLRNNETGQFFDVIHIQPHGRLGDLDALTEYVHQQDDWLSETAIHAFCGILCKTPTIIPAEKKEENNQREYEMAVEAAQYCELYEPTYDPETGAL